MSNFAGGLNTSVAPELIDATQLAEIVNMEISNGGQLRTVLGTKDVVKLDVNNIKAGAWDNINNMLLLFCKDGATYSFDGKAVNYIGLLSGDSEVCTIGWEDGILIASGGHLQYAKYVDIEADETTKKVYKLIDIVTSPIDSNGVYVRSGRVFVFDSQDNLLYSGVGDEEMWAQDSNDPSTSVFTQIGYKVGGKIIGLISMQSYVLVIKDNGKVYRLENEYPDWAVKEVTSNGACKGKAAYTSVGSNVFILGDNTLQAISPTDDAGNMPVNYVGKQIDNEIANLPANTKMRFMTEQNQLWFITNTQWVLVYDCNTQTFFQRYFNADVVDVVGNYIIKKDRVSIIDRNEELMEDNGEPMPFVAKMKTEMAMHDILVKHVDLSVMPLVSFYTDAKAELKVGKILIPFPKRKRTDDKIQSTVGVSGYAKDIKSTFIAEGTQDVFLNAENISKGKPLLFKKRQICRTDRVDVELNGCGFPFILNFISYDKVEV